MCVCMYMCVCVCAGIYHSHPLPTPWIAPNLTNPTPGLHMPCQNKTAWHATYQCRGKTFIFAHTHMHEHMHAWTHTHAHTHTHTHTHMRTHTHMHTHMHVCACVCACVCMCTLCMYVLCYVYATCVYGTHLSIDGTRENTKSVQTSAIKAAQQCSAAFIQHISLLSSCYLDL